MKFLLTIVLLISMTACMENQNDKKPEATQSIDTVADTEEHYSKDELTLKYSTYIYVTDRIFRKEGGKRFVKMKTNIVNKTDQDIFCISGWLVVKDDYSEKEFCRFFVDCPKDIPKNSKIEHTTHEYACDPAIPMHKKLLEMDPVEFNSWITWEVEKIKFEDGTVIESKNKRKK
jgi:hypothetical protein